MSRVSRLPCALLVMVFAVKAVRVSTMVTVLRRVAMEFSRRAKCAMTASPIRVEPATPIAPALARAPYVGMATDVTNLKPVTMATRMHVGPAMRTARPRVAGPFAAMGNGVLSLNSVTD